MLKLNFALVTSLVILTGCNATSTTSGGGSSSSSNSAATAVSPGLTVVSVPTPNPTSTAAGTDTFSVTYYRIISTVAPLSSYPTETYSAKGYCVVYKSNTYCWDDGMQTLQFTISGTVHGPYTYTYWGLGTTTVGDGWGQCSGACQGDLMSTPILMTNDVQTNLPSSVSVNKMMTQGTAISTNCTEGNQVLNCTDFTIDLNQTAL